jgi:hypothetical protein
VIVIPITLMAQRDRDAVQQVVRVDRVGNREATGHGTRRRERGKHPVELLRIRSDDGRQARGLSQGRPTVAP